jgi:hypothetical protein
MNKNRRSLLASGSILILILLILIGITYTGSHKEQQSQEQELKAIEASAAYSIMDKDWSVNYHVKKKRIYVENIIPKFSFQGSVNKKTNDLDGYIAVFVNGKWKMNVNQSIFILKNMNQGKHKITLQLKKKDGSDYGLNKNIYVHIR